MDDDLPPRWRTLDNWKADQPPEFHALLARRRTQPLVTFAALSALAWALRRLRRWMG